MFSVRLCATTAVLLLALTGKCGGNGPLPDDSWFDDEKVYTFSYNSRSLLGHSNITTDAQVSIQVVSEDKAAGQQELFLTFTAVQFSTHHGGTVKERDASDEFYGNWFSVTRSARGTVDGVFYPDGEELQVLAFKKAVAGLLSFTLDPLGAANAPGYTSKEPAVHGALSFSNTLHGLRLERHATTSVGLSLYRVDSAIEFSAERGGSVESVVTNERWSTAEHPLAGLSVYDSLSSSSQLRLLKVAPSDQRPPSRPSQLKHNTLVVALLPGELSHGSHSSSKSVQEQLTHCLSGAATAMARCQSKLSSLLSNLSLAELKDIVYSSASVQQGKGTAALLRAMVRTDNPAVPSLFAELLSNNKLHGVVLSVLPRLKVTPSASLVDHLWALSEGGEEGVAVQALFVLGALAGRHSNSSSSIIQKMHALLQEHTSAPRAGEDRLKRSLDSAALEGGYTRRRAALLDALGNAGSPDSLGVLMGAATEEGSTLAVQHAAVRALRKFQCKESANILYDLAAKSDLHPTVREAAARLYHQHPRAEREATEQLLHSSRLPVHHVHRRATDDSPRAYNVTAPGVRWSERFGREHNVSAELSKWQINTYVVSADEYSTTYKFSLFDESRVSAHLDLSGGRRTQEPLRTQLCYEGTATYRINMLNAFNLNYSQETLEDYVPLNAATYTTSVSTVTSTGTSSADLQRRLQAALASLPERTNVTTLLTQFTRAVAMLVGVEELRTEAETVAAGIRAVSNDNSNAAYGIATALSPVMDSFFQSYPQSVTGHFGNFPEIDSFAPLRTLNEVYSTLWAANTSLSNAEMLLKEMENFAATDGVYGRVVDPSSVLYHAQRNLTSLKQVLEFSLLQDGIDDSTRTSLQALQSTVEDFLEPAVSSLLTAASELLAALTELRTTFTQTQEAFSQLVELYETSRAHVDAVFGLRFNTSFPNVLRPCDSDCGCGGFPSTSNGRYNKGIDLLVSATTEIFAPVAGIIVLEPEKPAYGGAIEYDPAITVEVVPTDFNLRDHRIIITNLSPNQQFTSGSFVPAGALLGTPSPTSTCSGAHYIHVEVVRRTGGADVPVNPTPFLQPLREPSVQIEFECNQLVVMEMGMVVATLDVSGENPERMLLGEPLIDDLRILPHEFPQSVDQIVSGSGAYSPPSVVEFFSDSTSLMVGPNMVSFEFSATGTYSVNFSSSLSLLSKLTKVDVSPYVHIDVSGASRVGASLYSEVDLSGVLVEGATPSSLQQDWSRWPLTASSAMDLSLVPSSLSMSTRLVQQTGVGERQGEEEEVESDTLWRYSIPPVARNEYWYTGSASDDTAPVFSSPLPNVTDSLCTVRQLPWRHHDNPAFELDFQVCDAESVSNVSLEVTAVESGAVLIQSTPLRGLRFNGPYAFPLGESIRFTLTAANSEGLSSTTSCELPFYDQTPPLARITPRRSTSSHPSQLEALFSLFGLFELSEIQEVAVGTRAGPQGHDIMEWKEFRADLLSTPPPGASFSFGRAGRLTTNIINVLTVPEDICSSTCLADVDCLSFDHSSIDNLCVLHDGIEGPTNSEEYDHIFGTPPLRSSRGFYHFEKLGAGNSVLMNFTGLSLQHGRRYYINLRLSNKLGYTNIVSSPPITIDLTPPEPGVLRNVVSDMLLTDGCNASFFKFACLESGEVDNHRVIVDGTRSETVFNGPLPLVDQMYTRFTEVLAANWDGFHDDESGIRGYAWCIGTSIGSCDILPFEDPHTFLLSTSLWTNSAVAAFTSRLPDGEYFVTVQAESDVSYGTPLVTTLHHSTPYTVDTQHPSLTNVQVLGYDAELNQITLDFVASDNGSGISDVSFGLGLSPSDTSVLDWTSVAASGSGLVTVSAAIPDGLWTYVKLRATDRVGLSRVTVHPQPVFVDRTPPQAGSVRDGSTPQRDAQYQSSSNEVCVNYNQFVDQDSGISSFLWTVVSDDVELLSRELSVAEMTLQTACEAVSRPHNSRYYSTITAFNGGSNEMNATGTSDGVLIDTTPPMAGTVLDGIPADQDLAFSSCFSCATANWNGFQDTESGIDHYHVSIQLQPSGMPVYTEVFSVDIDSSHRTLSLSQFSFSTGDQVRVVVDAFNGAGASTSVESSGVTIDLTPPTLTHLLIGPQSGSMGEHQYHSNVSALSVNWGVGDGESGVAEVRLSILMVVEGIRIQIHPDPSSGKRYTTVDPSLSQWTVSELALTSGAVYEVEMEFFNGAGLSVVHRTPAVVVDITPPVIHSVEFVGGESVTNENGTDYIAIATSDRIQLVWSASDFDAGISSYSISVRDAANTSVLPGDAMYYETDGYHAVIDGLQLSVGNHSDGPFYTVVVKAVNRAGLQSNPFTLPPFLVVPGPTAGVIFDGENPDEDIDYTYNVATVTAHFSGFRSSVCGGIQHYEWSIGSGVDEGERDSVMGFTSRGLTFSESEGRGRAQMYLDNLSNQHGSRIFVTVRGEDGCGGIYEASSDGFLIDTSPPEFTLVSLGSNAVDLSPENSTDSPHYYQSDRYLSAYWMVLDPESGLEETFTVKVGTYPGGEDIASFNTSHSSFRRETYQPELEGVAQYTTIVAESRAGLQASVALPPLTMDTTPPLSGVLSCPQFILGDLHNPELSVISSLTCEWTGFTDPQSSVHTFSLMIGTSLGGRSTLSPIVLSAETTSFVAPFLEYAPSIPYYVTLETTNGVGLKTLGHSEPIYVETTPPSPTGPVLALANYLETNYSDLSSAVLDLPPAGCILETSSLTVQWDAFEDNESSVVNYQVALGSVPLASDVVPFTDAIPYVAASGRYEYVLQGIGDILNSIGKAPVFANVRGFNGAGMATVLTSQPLYVDTAFNTDPSWVYDGCAIATSLPTDEDYQTSTTTLCATLHIGINCPLRSLHWAVEGIDGLFDMNFTEVSSLQEAQAEIDRSQSNTFQLRSDDLRLYDDQTYRVIVRTYDVTGRRHLLRSDGMHVTTRPLVPGTVRDGILIGHDLNYQEPVTSVGAHWSGFGDGTAEQEIISYEIALGTDRRYPSTKTNIVPFTDVGLSTVYTLSGLQLVPMDQLYYVTVRARAVSGATIDVTSNGIRVGFSELIRGEITVPRYLIGTMSLSFHWSGFESDLPIRSYEWALAANQLADERLTELCGNITHDFAETFIVPFTNIALDRAVDTTPLSLQHGATYYVAVRAVDEGEKCLTITSTGILVDTTPPLAQTILAGPDEARYHLDDHTDPHVVYLGRSQDILVSWQPFLDNETAVVSYEISIQQQGVCGNTSSSVAVVADYQNVQLALQYIYESSSIVLHPGIPYMVAIRATNAAGLSSIGYSFPLLITMATPSSGDINDGPSWEQDMVYQSDLTVLSATYSHAKLRPVLMGEPVSDPCPRTMAFSLYTPDPQWSAVDLSSPQDTAGTPNSNILYESGQVTHRAPPGNPPGVVITMERNRVEQNMLSGAYRLRESVSLEDGDRLSVTIRAAMGEGSLQRNAVTSVVWYQGPDNFLPNFDLESYNSHRGLFDGSPIFDALGVSVYNADASNDGVGPKVVLWYFGNRVQSSPLYSTAEVFFSLSLPHEYTLKLKWDEQDFNPSYSCYLTVDGLDVAVLHGIPALTRPLTTVLSVFNHLGFLPINDPANPPQVTAVFSNVILPVRSSEICRYGNPFYSWETPFIRFEAGVGTAPGLTDTEPLQVVLEPCLPCLPGPCENFSCSANCTLEDPTTFTFSFSNLTLQPGYFADQSDAYSIDLPHSLSPFLSSLSHFTPVVYYITVVATTTSGHQVMSSSNGVTIDITPPEILQEIRHFDVTFNPSRPILFQGSNDTISVSWNFADEQSGISEYTWAIGTSPGAADVMNHTSVGTATYAISDRLLGLLTHNVTYYVTVVAVNGAGLTTVSTSRGVTYIATELNATELEQFVLVLEVEEISVPSPADRNVTVMLEQGLRVDFAGVSWEGIPEEVDQIFWGLGTNSRSVDILPFIPISFGDAQYAEISTGVLYINGTSFANISEVLATAESKEEETRDNLLSIEPGRVFYHTLQMCNVAHRCQDITSNPGIIIRPQDHYSVAGSDGRVNVSLIQPLLGGAVLEDTPTVDRPASLIVTADSALLEGSAFAAGFLSDLDLQRYYRASTPYISNPYTTMGQTSVNVSRRFTDIGGPSFYISFLGQSSLLAPLQITASFDQSLDWFNARPELLYWDVTEEVWRGVGETCGNTPPIVDMDSYTLTANVCSTMHNSRRRRQVENATAGFLDRAVHLLVGQIGSFSINTPPRLQLPIQPLQIMEHPAVFSLDLSTLYTDAEGDIVTFHLISAPQLGTVNLTANGQLTYLPCPNCTGREELFLYIIEEPFGINIPMSDTGVLVLDIVNRNVAPEAFFFADVTAGFVYGMMNMSIFLDNNRTQFSSVALIGGFDVDGFNDDLSVVISGATSGDARAEVWLDVVAVSGSLPVVWPANATGTRFNGYMAFLGVNVTYLPHSPSFTGTEVLFISVRDSSNLFSHLLTLVINIFDSPCQNGGRCSDSALGLACVCDCAEGFFGDHCEASNATGVVTPAEQGCPRGIPLMSCDGNPCDDAACPSHPSAVCTPNYCGECVAEWYVGDSLVECNANDIPNVCEKPFNSSVFVLCSTVTCDCPPQPFPCPRDSILVERRLSSCCVQYECVCPHAACPVLAECDSGVQPVPMQRGHGYPGYCCPQYQFEDIDECALRNGRCSESCSNEFTSHQCACPEGVTLAADGRSCGVCLFNGNQYLYGDRVQIGCNWCECQSDAASPERWRCTAEPCTPACRTNGNFVAIGDIITPGLSNCTCEATDTGADWACLQGDT